MTIAGFARRPLRSSRLCDVNAGLRQTLEDFVQTGRHPLKVIGIIITIVVVVFIGGFLLGFPPLPLWQNLLSVWAHRHLSLS